MLNKTEHILQNNKCDKCRLTIHPDFIGYHKCGYANYPICKIQSQIRNTGSTSDPTPLIAISVIFFRKRLSNFIESYLE